VLWPGSHPVAVETVTEIDTDARDPDHALEAAELEAFEAERGRLPAGGALLLCTGWDRKGDDPARLLGGDDAASLRFPGFGPSAAAQARVLALLGA
jgi:kynurenine formamidase